MYFLLFILIFVLVFLVDKYAWNSITPNTIAILPIALLCVVQEFIGGYYGFVELNGEFYVIMILFSIFGLLASLGVKVIFIGVAKKEYLRFEISESNFINVFFYSCLLLTFFGFLKSALNFNNFSEEDFLENLSYGFMGHIYVIVMVTGALFALYKNKKNAFYFLIISIAISLLMLKQVKSWVVFPILFYLILSYFSKPEFREKSLRNFILLVLTGIILFFSIYLMGFAFSGSINNIDDIFNSMYELILHCLFYLFSGILAFSEGLHVWHEDGVEISYLWNNFINIYSVMSGEDVRSAVSLDFFKINNDAEKYSNVYTLFGTLFYRSGYYAIGFYFSMIFIHSVLYVYSKKYEIIFWIYSFSLAFLSLAWFDYYYFHLIYLEGMMILFMLFLAKRIRFR